MTFDRRSLLISGAALTAALALEGCKDARREARAGAAGGGRQEDTERALLDTLEAAACRILPSDELGPGAKEANVRGFFEQALSDERLAHLVPLLKRGARFLDGAAGALGGAPRFASLPAEKQDEILERLAKGKMRPNGFRGPVLMRVLVALTLEGFLGHPRHGGNRDRVAWSWLGYSEAGRGAVFGEREAER